MEFLKPTIVRKVNGQDMAFTFSFNTLGVLAKESDLDAFDEATPFEQVPILLYAGLVAGKNQLPEGFSLADMDAMLFTMSADDVAEVFQHGTEALGFIGQAMAKLVKIAENKPAKG